MLGLFMIKSGLLGVPGEIAILEKNFLGFSGLTHLNIATFIFLKFNNFG